MASWTAERYQDYVQFSAVASTSMIFWLLCILMINSVIYIFFFFHKIKQTNKTEIAVQFGVIISQSNFFEQGAIYSGILGLAYPPLAQVSRVDAEDV